jgi:hypothetical protein
MDIQRHKTQRKVNLDSNIQNIESDDKFKNFLEAGARDAYLRPWHRLERGLRLNRLRMFIDDIAPEFNMTKEEKEHLHIFLQKSLDKKLLNTLKVVNYNQNTQRIATIKGFEIKRNQDDVLKYGFVAKKAKTDVTRKKKKADEIPSVSVTQPKIKIDD